MCVRDDEVFCKIRARRKGTSRGRGSNVPCTSAFGCHVFQTDSTTLKFCRLSGMIIFVSNTTSNPQTYAGALRRMWVQADGYSATTMSLMNLKL